MRATEELTEELTDVRGPRAAHKPTLAGTSSRRYQSWNVESPLSHRDTDDLHASCTTDVSNPDFKLTNEVGDNKKEIPRRSWSGSRPERCIQERSLHHLCREMNHSTCPFVRSRLLESHRGLVDQRWYFCKSFTPKKTKRKLEAKLTANVSSLF